MSIAVLGAPGGGKSFGVKELAKSVSEEIKQVTFNLSQFSKARELIGAFHQVRDLCLKGMIPLVFWDEFDTTLDNQPYGWLRYFLAPMQDGQFQEGQVTHPIGKSIFVFAGGTIENLEQLTVRHEAEKSGGTIGRFLKGLIHSREPYRETIDIKKAKGPDFVSRLKGILYVKGINPIEEKDQLYVIRRAQLLYTVLKERAPHLQSRGQGIEQFQFDKRVLDALLHTRVYRHGARSMIAVVEMSRTGNVKTFQPSCLPTKEQLSLHVDADDFMRLVCGENSPR